MPCGVLRVSALLESRIRRNDERVRKIALLEVSFPKGEMTFLELCPRWICDVAFMVISGSIDDMLKCYSASNY